jgi:hypothetical protein
MTATDKTHIQVPEIIDALRGPTVSVAEALAPGGIPATEGFYAWWASKKLLTQVPVYRHPSAPWRLL